MREEQGKAKNIAKGQCLGCEFCKTKDDGYQRSLVCAGTKRGRAITWTMHTGKLTGGLPVGNGYYMGGSFAPNPAKKLDEFLKQSIQNRIPPKWCKDRKDAEKCGKS